MKWSREPVLISALIAGVLAAVGGALVTISQGVPVLAAVGTAITQIGLVVGGGYVARTQAYSPHTADQIMDADAIIGMAERDGLD